MVVHGYASVLKMRPTVMSEGLQQFLGNPGHGFSLLDSFCFSVVTFTTLGFGDWRARFSSCARYCVMVDAFAGTSMMALSVFVLGSSVGRRSGNLLDGIHDLNGGRFSAFEPRVKSPNGAGILGRDAIVDS